MIAVLSGHRPPLQEIRTLPTHGVERGVRKRSDRRGLEKIYQEWLAETVSLVNAPPDPCAARWNKETSQNHDKTKRTPPRIQFACVIFIQFRRGRATTLRARRSVAGDCGKSLIRLWPSGSNFWAHSSGNPPARDRSHPARPGWLGRWCAVVT